DEDVDVYLRIFRLFPSTDTVLLAEIHSQLQIALNSNYDYCKMWNLVVNEDKTKVIDEHVQEIVEDFANLGLQFNLNGNFSKTKTRLVELAR
ncbi:hypothetical protein MAR_025893, partial [Mya arenaria]